MNMLDVVLTSEAAAILQVSKQTVITWERRGQLPAIKTRKGVRLFNRQDVERLAAERAAAEATLTRAAVA